MQQSDIIKQQVSDLAQTIVWLRQQKTELELRIEELEHVKQALTRLLPPDDRIERLFS